MNLRRSVLITAQIFSWSLAVGLLLPGTALAESLAGSHFQLPAWEELLRVVLLQDYNTRVVIIGTALLGLASGLVGTFLLLRKRALLSDTLSHATLPGIALMFIIVSIAGGEGKNLLLLILGAAVFSVLGTAAVIIIQKTTRLKDDAALGIVLSVSFGLGIALLGIATRMETGNAAGLSSFIYGKTASMLFFDAVLIGIAALLAAIFCLAFFKEFTVICFDSDYAASQGWPVVRLDFFHDDARSCRHRHRPSGSRAHSGGGTADHSSGRSQVLDPSPEGHAADIGYIRSPERHAGSRDQCPDGQPAGRSCYSADSFPHIHTEHGVRCIARSGQDHA